MQIYKSRKELLMIRSGKGLSLKKRIFLFFFGILILMVVTYVFTIGRFITRFTEERLDTDYNALVAETCDTMENILWDLTLTSQQILENEDILISLADYQNAPNRYTQQENYSYFLDLVSPVTMGNSNIGLIYLYDMAKEDFIYYSLPVSVRAGSSSVLYENPVFCFQGPCKSQSDFFNNPVLILNRTEEIPGGNLITLSLESGAYSMDKPLKNALQKSAYLLFTGYDGELLYSTLPQGSDSSAYVDEIIHDSSRKYRSFSKESSQGWAVHAAIPNSVYTRDYRMALKDFILYTVPLAFIAGFYAFYFWETVYRPLQQFDRQITYLLSDEMPAVQMHSSIPEYEGLFQKIALLQKQIKEMLTAAIYQEKQNSCMQLEKLRAQINPHFLMNTLNTLHWMALMNHQNEIDHIIQSLSHLLSYNLDKQSSSTNLGNELTALKEYIALQKVRYLFDFRIVSSQDPDTLLYPCPKFILQPLAENALSHGYREQMHITITIRDEQQMVALTIEDSGTGIQPETLERLQKLSSCAPASSSNPSLPENTSLGIGLQYVIHSLNDFYNGDYKFFIESVPDNGTVITLKLPKLKGGGYHAENIDH